MKNWEETNAGYVEGFHVDLEYDGPRRSVILRAPGSNIQSMSVDVFQKWFQVISDNTSSVTCRALRKQGKIPRGLYSEYRLYGVRSIEH